MRIISLAAENLKRIEVVEIVPHDAVVQITGKNKSGKSSVLDAILYAVGGGKTFPKEPVRRGADRAKVVLDLGEMVVTRTFTPDGNSTVKVEAKSGARLGTPQTILDQIYGAISFDPLEFTRMKPVDQFDMLRRIAKLEVDIDALDGLNQKDYDERTDANRQAERLRSQLEVIRLPADLPEAPVDLAALLKLMQDGSDTNTLIARREEGRASAVTKVADLRASADGVEARAAERQAEFEKAIERLTYEMHEARSTATVEVVRLREEAANLQTRLDTAEPLPAKVDLADLGKQIEAGRTVNDLIAKRARQRELAEQAKALADQSAALTMRIDARKATKADAIKSAKMPVDGIGFGDKFVTLNGLPLDQASGAEQLRVSVAIAMAANPKLRVMLIRDGSLLDDVGMTMLRDMVESNDYQVWVETVFANGPVAVEMVEGRAKAIEAAQ